MSQSPGSGGPPLPPPSPVEQHVRGGERVLWEGSPDPGVVFARQDAFLVPFSLLWGAFAAIWEVSAITSGTAAGAAFGAPLAAFGAYIVAGRFVYKWHDRRRTRYAVTDQRAIVLRRSGRQVLTAPVAGPMAVIRRRDGRHGSVVWAVLGLPPHRRGLTFSGGNATMLRGTGWPVPGGAVVSQVAFFDVDGFDALLAAVSRARQAAGATEPPRTLAPSGPARGDHPYGTHPYRGQPLGGPPPVPPPPAPAPRRPPAPPAGWYPDPDPAAPVGERWWDGVGWTDHVRSPGPPR
ncbi:MAG: DUF2510 domain-containing protein [Acidimicrobiales bacterium]